MPTHLISAEGTLKPVRTRYRPREQRGTRARNYRAVDTRAMSEFDWNDCIRTALASLRTGWAHQRMNPPAIIAKPA